MTNKHDILFETWKSCSAPMFHTSRFWPDIIENDVQKYLSEIASTNSFILTKKDLSELKKHRKKIKIFIEKALKLDVNIQRKNIYIEFEKERLMQLECIENAYNNIDVERLNIELFGSKADLLTNEVVGYFYNLISDIDVVDSVVNDARNEVLKLVTKSSTSGMGLIPNTIECFNNLSNQLSKKIRSQFKFIYELNISQQSSSKEVTGVLNRSIVSLFGADCDWRAAQKVGAPNAHIDYFERAIVLPTDRIYSLDHVNSLVVHELGVHVARSRNGFHTAEKLAGYGLPGYSPFEEALGVLFDHAYNGHKESYAASLPVFIIEIAKQNNFNFTELVLFIENVLICMSAINSEVSSFNYSRLRRAAFNRAIRMSRLGDGKIVDFSATKYWRGILLLVERYRNKELNEDELTRIMIGKYDVNNQEQFRLLAQKY